MVMVIKDTTQFRVFYLVSNPVVCLEKWYLKLMLHFILGESRPRKNSLSMSPSWWNSSFLLSHPESSQKRKKKGKFSLPWWMIFPTWALLWVSTLVSVAFVTFYGISFGDAKCKKWITSLIVSIFTSIFLTQPVKVRINLFLFFLFLCVSYHESPPRVPLKAYS